jgi:tRNA(Ile)-lysidine synthase
MLQRFTNFVSEKSLFTGNDQLLLAVSGGMDSVVLCHLLHKSGSNFSIAHCNFNLRAQESDQDEAFVKKLAKKYKVRCFIKSFETQQFADENKLSVQMAARELRYNWFRQLAADLSFDKILTAHHQSDLAETVLLNLIRGTGISGLHGIKPLSGNLARPLLFATREEIMGYIAEEQLTWREDSSNASTKYSRNFVRQEIIPLIKKLNPSFEDTLKETVQKVSAAEEIFKEQIDLLRVSEVRESKDFISVSQEKFRTDKFAEIRLFEILRPYNFTFPQIKFILDSIDEPAGKHFESPTHLLVNDRGNFIITHKNLEAFSSLEIYTCPGEISFEGRKLILKEMEANTYKISPDKNIAALDAARLKFPLTLRKWKEGDWFMPLGMNKKKKLSDFFIDEKVPLNLKDQKRVLVSDGAIVYIPGMRVDDRFKITEETERIIEIRYLY